MRFPSPILSKRVREPSLNLQRKSGHLPAVMGNHKEAVQHAEGQSGDREEIHGRDHFPVIAQESLPSLTWISPPRGTLYPARNGPLGNIKAQLKQFSVDARCAPGRFLRHHREDELVELLADRFST